MNINHFNIYYDPAKPGGIGYDRKTKPMKPCTRDDFEKVGFGDKYDYYNKFDITKSMVCAEFGEEMIQGDQYQEKYQMFSPIITKCLKNCEKNETKVAEYIGGFVVEVMAV